ncbi:MAG: hypothetical protein RI883_313 [Bacteroidota bacterium]|jgi:hypothetical protein
MTSKNILTILFSFFLSQALFSQLPNFNPKNDVTLSINDDAGTNGLAVAYNAKKDLYYSVFAGNETYNIEVHNAAGVSLKTIQIGGDLRGFWYNESKNQLQGILYGNTGSFSYDLDGEGYPIEIKITDFSYGMEEQNVAVFNNGIVYFANYDGVSSFKQGKKKLIKPKKLELLESGLSDNINFNGFIHTGLKGYEYGFYNYETSELYLVNAKTGKTSATIQIQIDDYFGELDAFRISFCNNRLFLYNVEDRTWNGFNIIN